MADPKVSLDLKQSLGNPAENLKDAVKENVSAAVTAKKEEVKADAKVV